MARISTTDLHDIALRAFLKAGVGAQDAEIIIDHLLENEYSGKSSHGLVRIPQAIRALREYGLPKQPPTLEHDNGSFAVLDAHRNIGVLAVMKGAEIAAERASERGIALVGIRNYIATSGSMTYYLRRLCAHGLVSIMGCNSVAQVAPPGGRKRMIGTNPVGIGIPGAKGEHFVADFATSAIAYGKILVMKDKGEAVPPGLLIDKDGHPSTDPRDAYDGAILPLEGYKGFALGLMVEMLAGPLIGAGALKQDLYNNDGCFIVAFDPKSMGKSLFYNQISEIMDDLKSSPLAPGASEITLPGERSAAALAQTQERSWVDVADKTLQDLRDLEELAA